LHSHPPPPHLPSFPTRRSSDLETFCSNTIPLLMLPEQIVEKMHGSAALRLIPGEDLAARLDDIMHRPEFYWDAVLKTRAHLAAQDRKSTRLNSSHLVISYAVFC